MEKFILRRLFFTEKLNVIDEQHVNLAVFFTERVAFAGADGIDELIHEGLGRYIEYVLIRIVVQYMIADRVQKVRLAKAGIAPDKQRVVGISGPVGNGQAGVIGQLIMCSFNKGFEGITRV